MAEVEKYNARGGVIGRIWAASLVRRLVGLAGLVMIVAGYGLILDSSDMTKTAEVEDVIRHAVSGMAMVFCGGVIEVLVLLGWARR